MEPKNHPIEKENHLPNLHFLVSMLVFRGIYTDYNLHPALLDRHRFNVGKQELRPLGNHRATTSLDLGVWQQKVDFHQQKMEKHRGSEIW